MDGEDLDARVLHLSLDPYARTLFPANARPDRQYRSDRWQRERLQCSGALVAGAAVVFVSEATREERTLATNAQGERQAALLQTENATPGRVIDENDRR